ncbi:MAG: hypothetical protein EPN26_07300, partial [Rhodospirillales bacterium]
MYISRNVAEFMINLTRSLESRNMASKLSLPWPVRPAILPGEAFSSWFARLAVGNGLRPEELYRVYLPGAYLCGRDLDRFACESLIEFLSQRTG